MLDEIIALLEESTAKINDASHREEQLLRAVDRWLAQAKDEALDPAARATYLDCAETITDIYR